MLRLLLTAFQPYGEWPENASALALAEFLSDVPSDCLVTARTYPVNFAAVPALLERDLSEDLDVALHLGQAPGSTGIRLEQCGVNLGREPEEPPDVHRPLIAGGPAAYFSSLPLAEWAARLRDSGIPAAVSFHAGTYLCNAVLYWSLHFAATQNLRTRAAFIHVPFDLSQAARQKKETPSLPAAVVAQAVRLIVRELQKETPVRQAESLGQA